MFPGIIYERKECSLVLVKRRERERGCSLALVKREECSLGLVKRERGMFPGIS